MTADDIKALAQETHYERTHGFTLCFVLDAQGKWHMGKADHENEEDARKSAWIKAMNHLLLAVEGVSEFAMAKPIAIALTKTFPMTSDEYNLLMDGHSWPEQKPSENGVMLVRFNDQAPRFMNDETFAKERKAPFPGTIAAKTAN